jgi:hypothetical protein
MGSPPASESGGQFVGQLYLDIGELLGLVRGEIATADGTARTTILNGKK